MEATGLGCIGYVLKMFPRLSETFILNEILELERHGLSVHIFSLRRPAEDVCHADTKLVRARITYLPQTTWEDAPRVLLAHLTTWRRHTAGYRHALGHLLRKRRTRPMAGPWQDLTQACCIIRESVGVVSLHAHYLNLPAKIALLVHRIGGIPFSVTTHAKDIFQHAEIASPHVQERLASARFVVANSQFTARHITGQSSCRPLVHTIYNGINLQSFPPRRTIPKEPLILAVGRLVEKKGFGVLIEACRLLKERGLRFQCELVGTGRLSETLKEQIAVAGLRDWVRLAGPLPQEELRGYYERAMIFALPCIQAEDGDRDILPNVVKEAMAVGVPVVTSQLEGIEELVEHAVSGLLTPPADCRALADCLQLLLTDSGLRQRLARQAQKVIAERFDRRKCFTHLKTLFQPAVAADSVRHSRRMWQPKTSHERRVH